MPFCGHTIFSLSACQLFPFKIRVHPCSSVVEEVLRLRVFALNPLWRVSRLSRLKSFPQLPFQHVRLSAFQFFPFKIRVHPRIAAWPPRGFTPCPSHPLRLFNEEPMNPGISNKTPVFLSSCLPYEFIQNPCFICVNLWLKPAHLTSARRGVNSNQEGGSVV